MFHLTGMIFNGNFKFLKIIPVFICLNFALCGQEVILKDLTKGNWFIEGNLKDSLVKLARKRNVTHTYRQYAFTTSGILQRCDSIYRSEFDDQGLEKTINELNCNSPATYSIKNQIISINTGQVNYYFVIDPRKGGGYLFRRTKEEYFKAN